MGAIPSTSTTNKQGGLVKSIDYSEVGVSKEINLKRLKHFATLEQNWNGYTAEPIAKGNLEQATKLVELAGENQPEIFPLPDGDLQCEWENDKIYIELKISLSNLWEISWQDQNDNWVNARVRNNPKYALTSVRNILKNTNNRS